MAGCGYVCPQCGGSGYTDDGAICNWCTPEKPKIEEPVEDND